MPDRVTGNPYRTREEKLEVWRQALDVSRWERDHLAAGLCEVKILRIECEQMRLTLRRLDLALDAGSLQGGGEIHREIKKLLDDAGS